MFVWTLGISSVWVVHSTKLNTSGGPRDGALNVHLVAHTHDDVGWLYTFDDLYNGENTGPITAVRRIIDSVIEQLLLDENRKFVYVEMAFFSRWWHDASPEKRKDAKDLLERGQLEFANGGWVSNDEATCTFFDIVDQHTLGANFIANEIGSAFNPKVGWQIDPFGHSKFQAEAYAEMGFDAWYFSRTDFQDFAVRKSTRTLETIHTGILAGSMDGYGAPSGFDFDALHLKPELDSEAPNFEARLRDFVSHCREQASVYNEPSDTTQHIMLTMGSDFEYGHAERWFRNLDKLVHYSNAGRIMNDGGAIPINVFYSSPRTYTASRHSQTRLLKEDSSYDWFPYCDGRADSYGIGEIRAVTEAHAFWTGYFTSRPLLKKLVREGSSWLALCRAAELVGGGADGEKVVLKLWSELSVLQHHDAITGTSKQHVADDYMARLSGGINGCREFVKRVFPKLGKFVPVAAPGHVGSTADSSATKSPKVHLGYYNSYSGGVSHERMSQSSGHYIFRPECPEGHVAPCAPQKMEKSTYTLKQRVDPSDGATVVHWTVGPLSEEGAGTEVVLVVDAPWIKNEEQQFFTDSNGFEWVKRQVNKRVTWNLSVTDPVAGNYYPINAGIVIQDAQHALMVVPDRAVGGTSLREGQIEIMIHRRTFRDDSKGIGEPLDETDPATTRGIKVSGTTRIYLKKIDEGNDDITKPMFAVPVWALRPVVHVNGKGANKSLVELLGLNVPSPDVIVTHIHKIESKQFCPSESQTCVLLRLMNNHPAEDRSLVLRDVFSASKISGTIETISEVTLNTAWTTQEAATAKIIWDTQERHAPQTQGPTLLKPGHMRTFVLTFTN